jgi:hypothetical protein
MTDEQREAFISYFETLSGRLIDIPTNCAEANSAEYQKEMESLLLLMNANRHPVISSPVLW